MLSLVQTHKIKIARTNLNQFDIGRKYYLTVSLTQESQRYLLSLNSLICSLFTAGKYVLSFLF